MGRLPPHDVEELAHRDLAPVGPHDPVVTSEDRQCRADGADEEVRAPDALAPKVEQPLPDYRPHLLQNVAQKRVASCPLPFPA